MDVHRAPRALALPALVLLVLPAPALAATYTVGSSGDFATITEALAAATDGDTLELAAGTWTEPLDIRIDVALVGVDGSAATVIQATGTAITVNGATVSVSGVTIDADEHGINASGGEVWLDDVVIRGASSELSGGGIRAIGTAVHLVNVTFDRNGVGGENGGHVYLANGSLDAEGCAFTAGRGERGGALYGFASTIAIRDSVFSGNSVRQTVDPPRGGAIRIETGSLELQDVDFDGNSALVGFGGHLSVLGATLRIVGGSFVGGEVDSYYGGAITSYDTDLFVDGSLFEGNVSLTAASDQGHGGAILINGDTGTFDIRNAIFRDNIAEAYGGAIRIEVGTGTIRNSLFESNQAVFGGALHLAGAGDVVIRGSQFVANDGSHGGAIRWRPNGGTAQLDLIDTVFEANTVSGYGAGLYARTTGLLHVRGSRFVDNAADVGGAMMLWDVTRTDVGSSWFCGNSARTNSQSDGGAVASYLSGTLGLNAWTNNAFVGNRADEYGGGVSFLADESVWVVNNTFLANRSSSGGGHLAIRSTSAVLTNDLFAHGAGGDGVYGDSASNLTVGFSDFFDNVDAAIGGAFTPADLPGSNLFVDPLLTGFTDDGDCTNDELWPTAHSPLIDAGDPSLSDPDASRSDIGMYGGPEADPDLFVDADGDGWLAVHDCDDNDKNMNPGATEIPYDGLDQDCDGEDLDDIDEDGFEGGDGPDCDDEDPAVHPLATEIWYDGVDQDCDGRSDYDRDEDGVDRIPEGGDCDDERRSVFPGAEDVPEDGVDQDCDGQDALPDKACGCTVSGPVGWLVVLPILALVRRRRR